MSVLCRLICASLTEDRYGVVQRDIPKIIEALLSFLTALEDYQAELNAKYTLPGPEELKELPIKEVAERETLAMEAARASEVLSVVSDGTSAAGLIVPVLSLTACEHGQRSRTGLCRLCGRLGRSCPRSGFRRESRRSCRASWTTIDDGGTRTSAVRWSLGCLVITGDPFLRPLDAVGLWRVRLFLDVFQFEVGNYRRRIARRVSTMDILLAARFTLMYSFQLQVGRLTGLRGPEYGKLRGSWDVAGARILVGGQEAARTGCRVAHHEVRLVPDVIVPPCGSSATTFFCYRVYNPRA